MSKTPHEPGGWRYALAAAEGAPRCRARRKLDGQPCRAPAMANGRCHKHGGASTGRKDGRGPGAMPCGRMEAWGAGGGREGGGAVAWGGQGSDCADHGFDGGRLRSVAVLNHRRGAPC